MAHEIGHLLGMDHDFLKNNPDKIRFDKNNESCTKIDGIMDYTESRKSRWSPCSVEDFKDYYSSLLTFVFTTDKKNKLITHTS